MPLPLSPMGIFHTVIGILAIGCGIKLLWDTKQLSYKPMLGKIYLFGTFLTGASALMIFRHDVSGDGIPDFHAAHALGVLTVLAVVTGMILEKTNLFKSLNKYAVNLCYSGTFLFHMLPTATEILTRFPVEPRIVTGLDDPLLLNVFGAIAVTFFILLALQMNWLRKQTDETA